MNKSTKARRLRREANHLVWLAEQFVIPATRRELYLKAASLERARKRLLKG